MDKKNQPKLRRNDVIYGRNSVKEALLAKRKIECIFVSNGEKKGSIRDIISLAKTNHVTIKEIGPKDLDIKSHFANHQGVVATVSAYKYSTIDEILNLADVQNTTPFIVITDGIEDPYNLGAIIRTAECAGVHGVVIPKHNSTGLNSIVAKTSAGALEYMKVAMVTNISKTIDDLKNKGLWVYCADMCGEAYYKADFSGPIALVIGGEKAGVSRLVKEKCDFTVSLPLKGHINSLNASVAAGILMYEISKCKDFKK